MISICCVGFASLYVDLMIVSGILVCSSFLISIMYVYCVESFAHIECCSDCSRWGGGAIWLNPFATVLFTVCSAITVEHFVLFPLGPELWRV